ncbi:MAG: hypothetical protein JW804_00555 [Sedimentisphaerales bacterium]|nr:hypothetical protein [Sedimentisphaerales bacterium]
MPDKNEKLDPDILKAKMDILRARKAASKEKPQPGNTEEKQSEQMSDLISDVVRANKASHQNRKQTDVPEFDVSKKILSQQRNASATRRTAPGKTQPQPTQSVKPAAAPDKFEAAEKPQAVTSKLSEPSYNSLIAEIVVRDITRLCHSEASVS